jgi:hypothetical protein
MAAIMKDPPQRLHAAQVIADHSLRSVTGFDIVRASTAASCDVSAGVPRVRDVRRASEHQSAASVGDAAYNDPCAPDDDARLSAAYGTVAQHLCTHVANPSHQDGLSP